MCLVSGGEAILHLLLNSPLGKESRVVGHEEGNKVGFDSEEAALHKQLAGRRCTLHRVPSTQDSGVQLLERALACSENGDGRR